MSVEPIGRDGDELAQRLVELESLLQVRDLEIVNLRRLARCAAQILDEIIGGAG